MRLSDLLRAEVVDERDRSLGRVHDVRMAKDGPSVGGFGPAYRVCGLVIGRSSLGTRLGYDRGGLTAPWLLRVLFRRASRSPMYVPWERVRGVEAGRVRVEGEPERLPDLDIDVTPGD